MDQAVEHLLSKGRALSSNPITAKKEKVRDHVPEDLMIG
jgi:hypothetical protein